MLDGIFCENAGVVLSWCGKRGMRFALANRHLPLAELLKLRMAQQGYTVWIDSDRLGPGIDWREEIDQAIKKSRALIAVMSVEARASEYVTYEWAFAWGAGVKIIPIMLKETPLHPRLATLQYLDFTKRTARPWDRLLAALADIQNRSTRAAPSGIWSQ